MPEYAVKVTFEMEATVYVCASDYDDAQMQVEDNYLGREDELDDPRGSLGTLEIKGLREVMTLGADE